MSSSISNSRRARAAGLTLGLVAGVLVVTAPAAPAVDPVHEAPAAVETVPSDVSGDSVDDPAIWVDPSEPARSVVIAADHRDTSLSVYDLSGARLQKLVLSHGNNVDLRPGFSLGGENVPIVGLAGAGDVSFYKFDTVTRRLSNVTPGGDKLERADLEKPGEEPFYAHGMCLYNSPVSGRFYAFVVDRFGTIKQFELTDGGNGKVALAEVRQIDVEPRPAEGNPDQTEACVADEAGRSLFVAEQDWHIWRYGAEPTDPTGTADRIMVDKEVTEGGHFTREAEGLAVVYETSGASYLIASSQKANAFTVYRGTAPYEFVRQVHVIGSPTADGCENTDGIDAVHANLGPAFPRGIFICQDNDNGEPVPGNMNFKYARLEHVVPLGDAPPPSASTTTTTAPTTTTTTGPAPGGDPAPVVGPPAQPAAGSGYWMLDSRGRVYPFGDARHHDPAADIRPPAVAVDLESTPDGASYWIVDDRGAVYPHGDAAPLGSLPAGRLSAGETVTSLSSTPSGAGYWIFTSAGRAFAIGDAVHHGDMTGVALNGPVLDSIATPSGHGYYMVASDGGIFAFGDARYYGSMGGIPLNAPVQSLFPDPDGAGYWLVASDGGVFAFEAGFGGSMGGKPLNKPVTGMVPYGDGYLMVAEDGGIFNFSDKPFAGSLGDAPPADPITSVAAIS